MKRIEILFAIAMGCLIFMGNAFADQYHPASEVSPGDFRGTSTDSYKFPGRLYFSSGGSILGSPTGLFFLDSANKQRILIGGPTGLSLLKGTIYFSLGASGSSFYFTDASSTPNNLLTLSDAGNLYVKGNVGIGTTSPAYKLHVIGDIYANGGWLRTSGSAGWYSESYGGGWYMSDTSWIRTYNSKNVWTDTGLLGSNGGLTVGYSGTGSPSGGAIIAGNVGIGTTDPGTKKLKVAGDTEITDNLNVGGKTNIVNSKSTFDTWSSSGWDNVGECLQISPDTSYSAMGIMIRPDFYSDNGDASFWTNSDCTGTKVGNMNFFIASGGYTGPIGGPNYYYTHYTTFILPTTIKSIKIESRGDKANNQEVTPNVVITAYFK